MSRMRIALAVTLIGWMPSGMADAVATIRERAENEASAIGYASVAAARESLLAREDVNSHEGKSGWQELEDRNGNVQWSFVSADHPAYPTVIRRSIAGAGQSIQVNMDAICEAEKAACEALMREMVKMNEAARNRYLRGLPKGGGKARQVPIWSYLSGGRAQ